MKNPHTQIKTCAWLLACVILLTTDLTAQLLTAPIPSLHTATGRTALTELSCTANPALSLMPDSSFIGALAVPSRFGMQELQLGSLLMGSRITDNIGVIGGAGGLSNELYTEFSGILGGSMRLGTDFVVGISAEYSRSTFTNFSSVSMLQINTGALLTISPVLKAGVSVSNILRGSYDPESRLIRQTIRLGLGVELLPTLLVDADASIALSEYSGVTLAARYDALEAVRCRLAVSTAPRMAELSVALRPLNAITVVATGHYHDVLGLSEQLGVVWYW
ncbi:MAG: hypothetical protein U0264_16945 [Candidatus Kapaibacterium sp.]